MSFCPFLSPDFIVVMELDDMPNLSQRVQKGVKKGSKCSKSMKTMQKVVSTPRIAMRGVANQRGSK
jgi:hypothetical protein